jgi:hypothetical protein
MKDRALDLVDCFKADVGFTGVGIEAHMRVTDAVVTGVGAGGALKHGFKGRHVERGWWDTHIGLPFSCVYWFQKGEKYKQFPITYYGQVGNIQWYSMGGSVKSVPGSYEAESIILWPTAFEKDPRRFPPIPEKDRPLGYKYTWRPQAHPFEKDLVNSFDIEAGGTVALVLGLSLHVGFSPGQFLDFLLGWFGIDIGKDDYRAIDEKVDSLARGLKTGDRDGKIETIWSFREMRDKRAVPYLIEVLKDEDKYVRRDAAIVLGQIGDKSATMPLVDLTYDKEWEVRNAAVEALAHIGDARATDRLIQLLDSNLVRNQWLEEGLVKIGRPAIEPLIHVVADRSSAASALKRLTGQDFGASYEAWSKWWEAEKKSSQSKK